MKQVYFLHHRVRLLLWLLLLTGTLAARAQAPAWQAALSGNNNQPDNGTSTASATDTDAAGNVFITGNFSGKVAFGSTLLTSTGGDDVFVAKWDTGTSSWAWAVKGGGTGHDRGLGIAVSGTSVYVTGYIYNNAGDGYQVKFGGVTVPGTNAANTYDAVVVKYTDNGTSATPVWGLAGGGADTDNGNGIAVSGSSVYVTGYYRGTGSSVASFGSITLQGSGSSLNTNGFVVKYTDNGTSAIEVWATFAPRGNGEDVGTGIAVNGSSVYTTGYFTNNSANANSVQFAGLSLPGTSSSTTSTDAYVAKYTDGGTFVTGTWARSAGGFGYDYGLGIAVSGTSVYTVGQVQNDAANSYGVVFGSTALAGVGASANGDAFLAKYIDAGASAAVAWVQRSGGTDVDAANAVAVSGTSVYITGIFRNTSNNASVVQVAGVTLGGTGTTLNSDLFVAKYTDNGASATGVWAKSSRGTDDEAGIGLAVSGATVCVAAQTLNSIATFLTPNPLVQVPANAAVLGLLQTSNGTWTDAQAPLQGGTSTTKATATDAANNVYVTGSFTGQVAFGNTTLTSTGLADAFVAKWNSTTNTWAWAVRGGDAGDDQGNAIAVTALGVYVTGYLSGTSTNFIRFGNGVVVGSGSSTNTDAFVVKLTDGGTSAAVDWLVSGGGTGPDQGNGLAVSGSGVYVTGSYTNTAANNNNVSFASTALPGTGNLANYDVFVAKYTDGGASAALGWLQHGGGTGDDIGNGLAANGANLYVTGGFENSTSNGFNVHFGSLVLAGTGNGGQSDAFLVRYTDTGAAGTATWAEHGGGISTDAGQSVAVSANNVYVTGYFVNSSTNSANAQFGGLPLLGTGAGTNVEMFVAKYLDNGTAVFNWAQHGGGTGDDYGTGIAVNTGKVYVAGTYTNTSANANGVLFGSTALPGSGASANADIFVAKYTDGGTTVVPAWATGGGGAGPDDATSIAFSGARVYVGGTIMPAAAFGSITLPNPTGGSAINFLGKLVDALLVPTLNGISPNTGPVGTVVTLTGTNLLGTTTITFGGAANNTVTAGFVVNAAGTQITGVTVPTGAITGSVTATTPSGLSNGVLFTMIPAPTITGFSPTNGAPSTVVSITGTNFTGTTNVSFNGTSSALVTVYSPTSMSAVVPTGATTGPISVTAPGGTALSSTNFTVVPPATLTSISPSSGPVGTTLTLTGTNLTGTTGIFFPGAGAVSSGYVVNAAGTQITGIVVPVGTTTGNVSANTPSNFTNGLLFTVTGSVPAPTITSFTPTSGPIGTMVTLTGSNFTGATNISFNGTSALTFNVVSATSAMATVPVGASTGAISITTPGGTVFSASVFTVTVPAPTLTSLSPTSGAVGTVVTLTGSGFTGATGVSVNGAPALTFNVVNASTATATVPAGATTGNVTLTTPSGISNGVLFTVTPAAFPDLVVSTLGQSVAGGTYNSITVTGTGAGSLQGPVTVNTAVTVQAGGVLSTNCQPLTGAASFTLAAGGTLVVCDPAGINASGATGAVQTTGLRSFSTDASYTYAGSVAQLTGSGLPAQARNLTVNNPAGLALTQPLAVRQLLRLAPASGNFALGGQALTLLSDASGTALIANEGAGIVSGSTGTMQRYLDATGNLGSGGYRHYSAPVSGSTVADLQTTATGGAFIPLVNPAYNTSATPLALPPSQFPTVFGYDETRLATSPATGLSAFDKGWTSPAALSTPLALGRGYTVQVGNGEKVDFTGTFFTGPLSIGASRGTDPNAGWLLMGNPYPAPLDWGTVGAANTGGSGLVNIDAAAYVFQSTDAYTGTYRSFVNGIGAGTGLLAAGQGFFVRASTPGTPGSVQLTNANRVTTFTPGPPVFQRGTADPRPRLRLSLGLGTQPATPATARDEAFVYFQAGATAGIDGTFDAHKLANPSGYSLATATGATPGVAPVGLSIDGQPLLAAGASPRVVPLLLAVPAGTYTLTATELAHFADPASLTTVFLRDALAPAGTTGLVDLASTPSYTFAVAAGAAGSGRFALLFNAAAPLATPPANPLAQALATVSPNPVAAGTSTASLAVTGLPATVAVLHATLFNTIGQLMLHSELPAARGASAAALPTSGLASGVYVLHLEALDSRGQVVGTISAQRLCIQ